MQQNHDSDIYWLVTFLYCFLPTFVFHVFITFLFSDGDAVINLDRTLALQFIGVPAYIAIATVVIDGVRSKTRPASVPRKGHRFQVFLLILLSFVVSFILTWSIGAF